MTIIKNPLSGAGSSDWCHALRVSELKGSRCWNPTWLIVLFAGILLLCGCGPPGPRALLRGKQLIEGKEYKEAIEQLKTATSLLSTNAHAWNYLGLAYHYTGQGAEAEKAYQRALLCNRDLSEVHFNLGCLWLEQNKTNGARNELTAFYLQRPNSVEGLLKLGLAQVRCRELAAAEKSFTEVLRRLSPENAEALNGLGLVRIQQRRAVDAAQQFSKALRSQPGYAAALLNLAIVCHQYSKDRGLALQKYREYLGLKPTPENSEAVRAVAQQLESELAVPVRPVPTNAPPPTNLAPPANPATNHRSAAAAVPIPAPPAAVSASSPAQTASAPAPSSPIVTNTPKRAPPPSQIPETPVEMVKLEPEPVLQPAEAISPAHRPTPSEPVTSNATVRPPQLAETNQSKPKRSLVQRINPMNLFRGDPKPATRTTPLPEPGSSATQDIAVAQIRLPTSEASSASSTPTESITRYTYVSPAKPITGNHTEAERIFSQALQAQQKQRYSEAIQFYRTATSVDPAYYEAYYNMGLAASASGDSAVALIAYENALAIRPESLDARYNFALALKQANYPLDSVHELEKLLVSYPNEARAHLVLGNLYAQQLRQPANARLHYLKVLENDPRNGQASAIRNWLSSNPQ
jgi:tetratricopeptide (TPR) repeat protein